MARRRAALGAVILEVDVLIDGPTPNQSATTKNAYNWAIKYKTPYPVVIDPPNQLAPIFTMAAYPTNILVDTTTMTIVDVLTGAPDATYFTDNVGPLCP